jgi:phosphohistidine phosphatase
MQLLVIRHAIAEDRETFTGSSDAERPLTAKGKRRMRDGVRGMKTVIRRLDLLASSPLVRARQTADIVAETYRRVPRVEIAELSPGAEPEAFEAWLVGQAGHEIVAVVGHEPTLSQCVTWLLAGRPGSVLELKKGAACLVDFPGAVARGKGVLQWLLTPSQLRKLGA